MSLILAIETATPVCSVAVALDGELLSLAETVTPNSHAEKLTLFVEQAFTESGLKYTELDAVAVSMGPGSYTGLRIGVASAKGLCYALDKPLIAVPTLQAMAVGISGSSVKCQDSNNSPSPRRGEGLGWGPMIDARRMEVYCAVFDEKLKEVLPTDARIIDESSFRDLLSDHIITFAGNESDKCKPLLTGNPHARFLDSFQASARFMVPIAEQRFKAGQFENLAYFEPYYLKDFVARKPNVKGLR